VDWCLKRNAARSLTWPRNWRRYIGPRKDRERTDRSLKSFLPDAKVNYEMGPNGPGTIGKAQYVKAWGESGEIGVLLDR
jgi:hypothetical protein